MQQLSVVVFGATGFIGSHLVAHLSDAGYTVKAPTRQETGLGDDDTLRRLVAGSCAAINLVGILHGSRARPYGQEFRAAHVELPRRIAAACAAAGVPRFLHMSALGADPNGSSMYQRSKGDGELAARSQPTVAATVFRPSVVFGPDDHFLNLFARLQRHAPFVPLAAANARFQPVYVGDVAEAFVRALRDGNTRHAIVELGGPDVYTLGELVHLAGRLAGHERRVVALPDALARAQAALFEMLPGEPIITRDNLDSMTVDNVVSPYTKALTAESLGIKLTPVEAVAPAYLAPTVPIDVLRERAGR